MFYEYERHCDISDYNENKELRMDSILKIFQEAAITHSSSVGYTTDSYMGCGSIWMHNRNLFKVSRLPDYSEKLKVKTWSRGIEKFKGFRNYEIYANDKKCIAGSSIWIYLNIDKRRPVRPSPDMIRKYDSEDVPVFNDKIKRLTFKEPESIDAEITVQLRPADFDVNGHVSNVTYGQFFEMALREIHEDISDRYVGTSYIHEIKPDVAEVTVRAEKSAAETILAVYSGGICNCVGGVFDE